MLKNQKAFTIVELVIVLAIISILTGIVVFNVSDYIKKSKIAATKSSVNQIVKAMEMYRTKFGCLPTTGSSCSSDFGAQNQQQWDQIVNILVSNGFIADNLRIHKDSWGNPYKYDKNDYPGASFRPAPGCKPDGSCCSPIWSLGPNSIDDVGWGIFNYNCNKFTTGVTEGDDDIGISIPPM